MARINIEVRDRVDREGGKTDGRGFQALSLPLSHSFSSPLSRSFLSLSPSLFVLSPQFSLLFSLSLSLYNGRGGPEGLDNLIKPIIFGFTKGCIYLSSFTITKDDKESKGIIPKV